MTEPGPIVDVVDNYLIARELLLLLAEIVEWEIYDVDTPQARRYRDRIYDLTVKLKASRN